MNKYRRKSEIIVEKIIADASDSSVSGLLDERFNNIILAYRVHSNGFTVNNNQSFHRVIVWFLKNIYQDTAFDEQLLLTEGIFIIERFCQGFSQNGYEGIYYDLLNNNFDVEYFFRIFLEGIKNYHFGRAVEIACLRHIDPCNYQLKYAVIIEIIRKYGYLLQDEICRNPENYIDRLPCLFKPIISACETVSGMISR
jgi:hypothetical protein